MKEGNQTDSSSLERNFPTLNSVEGSGETQERQEPPASQAKDKALSIEALKANLFYAAAKKENAFHAHKNAIIAYEEALTALNNGLTQKHFKDWK